MYEIADNQLIYGRGRKWFGQGISGLWKALLIIRTPVAASFILTLSMVVHWGAAHAQDSAETLFDVYRLSSEASAEVDNDLMVVTLQVQDEDVDSAALADKINETMSWALEVLEPYDTLYVKTRDYQTYPNYENTSRRRLVGWRARQTIDIESDDFAATGTAIGELQERLTVLGIRLSVKPATRQRASDVLIESALNDFKARAQLVQRNMGSSGFRIVDVDINTQQSASQNNRSRILQAEAMTSSASAQSEPAIASGTTTVFVRVNGRIQLE